MRCNKKITDYQYGGFAHRKIRVDAYSILFGSSAQQMLDQESSLWIGHWMGYPQFQWDITTEEKLLNFAYHLQCALLGICELIYNGYCKCIKERRELSTEQCSLTLPVEWLRTHQEDELEALIFPYLKDRPKPRNRCRELRFANWSCSSMK
jgi:hypothetical protein